MFCSRRAPTRASIGLKAKIVPTTRRAAARAAQPTVIAPSQHQGWTVSAKRFLGLAACVYRISAPRARNKRAHCPTQRKQSAVRLSTSACFRLWVRATPTVSASDHFLRRCAPRHFVLAIQARLATSTSAIARALTRRTTNGSIAPSRRLHRRRCQRRCRRRHRLTRANFALFSAQTEIFRSKTNAAMLVGATKAFAKKTIALLPLDQEQATSFFVRRPSLVRASHSGRRAHASSASVLSRLLRSQSGKQPRLLHANACRASQAALAVNSIREHAIFLRRANARKIRKPFWVQAPTARQTCVRCRQQLLHQCRQAPVVCSLVSASAPICQRAPGSWATFWALARLARPTCALRAQINRVQFPLQLTAIVAKKHRRNLL